MYNVAVFLLLFNVFTQNILCYWMHDLNACIYVAGHTGLPGSALVNALKKLGYINIITRDHADLNLENTTDVAKFFENEKPEYVFIAAAKVPKPSTALQSPVTVLETNFRIVSNILRAALNTGTQKVLLIGSLYAYPTHCTEPVTENQLLTGGFDQEMQMYSLVKNMCIALCTAYNTQYHIPYISCIPAIIYGSKDFNDIHSTKPIIHIIHTLVDAYHNNVPSVTIKDTPHHMRDYLDVDSFAHACIFLMQQYNDATPINVGSGIGITTHSLVEYVAQQIGYTGTITYDETAYSMPAHVYNIDLITSLGWKPLIDLKLNINSLITVCTQKHDTNP